MQAGSTYQRGKSAAYCLDQVRGLGIRSSLLYCFKEERRQAVGDLKEVFLIGSYVCSDCSNIVEEHPTLRKRCLLYFSRSPDKEGHAARAFARLMGTGNVKRALRLITEKTDTGSLPLDSLQPDGGP